MDRVRRRIKDKRLCNLVKAFLKAGVLTDLGDQEESLTGTPQGGILTPSTQWATQAMVALRIGAGWLLVGAGGAFPDGDAVPDGDLLGSDEDVFDEQAQDVLALLDGRGWVGCPDLGEEAFHVDGELEVGLAVGELRVARWHGFRAPRPRAAGWWGHPPPRRHRQVCRRGAQDNRRHDRR
jgi:hypothetical protein